MKKTVTIVLSLILIASMSFFIVGAESSEKVGKLPDPITVIDGITKENLGTVRNLIRKEYNRGIQTRSVKHKGKAYFDYGKSTGEYVHGWIGMWQTGEGGTSYYNACMMQDFTGGYSDSLATLGFENNWCCILVTKKSLTRGEAYTVRDGIANVWGNAGGTNSMWGMPTDNQRWISGDYDSGPGMYCYQTFDNGYAMGLNAFTIFVNFYYYKDGYVAPTGGTLDYDWGVSSDTIGSPLPSLPLDVFTGDVDEDHSVTVSDVVKLRSIVIASNPTQKQLEDGDLDGNQTLDVSDVVALRGAIMKGNFGEAYNGAIHVIYPPTPM